MGTNVKIIPALEKKTRLRVAAYCRVSSEADEQTMSFDTQILYYGNLIEETPDWELAGIYAERFTGTDFENRTEYNRMVKDAKAGKIDFIITKSISRFGRNTLPFLKSLQELSLAGVVVYFQQEDLFTDDPQIQEPIRIAAAIAQSESYSKSQNTKWGIRHNFEQGKVQLNHTRFFSKAVSGFANFIDKYEPIAQPFVEETLVTDEQRKSLKSISQFADIQTSADHITCVMEFPGTKNIYQLVGSLEKKYLKIDPSEFDGEYKVLCKIHRKIPKGEKIELDEIFDAIKKMPMNRKQKRGMPKNLNNPEEFRDIIKGPAARIIPIAIYQ